MLHVYFRSRRDGIYIPAEGAIVGTKVGAAEMEYIEDKCLIRNKRRESKDVTFIFKCRVHCRICGYGISKHKINAYCAIDGGKVRVLSMYLNL